METLLGLFVLLFGIIIGSFLNVVALRFNTGRSINGRSFCFTCSTNLKWFELIPVLSYVIQHGKCNHCSAKISPQYPIVEFVTGILFVLIAYIETQNFSFLTQYSLLSTFFYWLVACILIVISVYDIKHKIIPDSLSYSFAVIALLRLILLYGSTLLSTHAIYLLAGPILFLPFCFLWLVSKGTWMGLGDAKLALGIGWLLGIVYGLSALALAFWIGTGVMVLVLIYQHLMHHIKRRARLKVRKDGEVPLTFKSEIPFAPFLIIGTLIVYMFNFDVLNIGAFMSMIQ